MSSNEKNARRKFLLKSTTAIAGLLAATAARAGGRVRDGFYCVPCFLKGTSIQTENGTIRVEDLSVGQKVVTASGELMPVVWTGSFSVDKGSDGKWGRHERPVKISKGAIDDATPSRDLWVSPGHALYIDGVLIPAGHLVNGQTIVSESPEGIEQLEYYHFKLETHDVVLAEGAPVETYLEPHTLLADNAEAVATCAPVLRLNGGRERLASYLRSAATPLVDVRSKLEVVRDRLALRARTLAELDAGVASQRMAS